MKQYAMSHPLRVVRVNRVFNGMSPVGTSIYCSPCHPAALQIDPPTSDGDLPLGITRPKDFSRQIYHHFTHHVGASIAPRRDAQAKPAILHGRRRYAQASGNFRIGKLVK